MTTITVYGSYGELTVHRLSGHIIAYDPDPEAPEYADIRWFDPATLPDQPAIDILGTGFAADTGYCRELVWLGPEEYWVEQLRLPKPNVIVCMSPWVWDEDQRGRKYPVYCEDPEEADGWSVWLRRYTGVCTDANGPEFTEEPDVDYPDHRTAFLAAQKLAADYGGVEVREY